jgi:hypothetical protein
MFYLILLCTFLLARNAYTHLHVYTHKHDPRYEIGQTFEKVFGAGSLNNRVKMVYASWTISEQEYYNNTLSWLESQYGPLNKYLYVALSNTTASYYSLQPHHHSLHSHHHPVHFRHHSIQPNLSVYPQAPPFV